MNLKREIVFRNKHLAENSKKTYQDGILQFLDYLNETSQKTNHNSIKNWLEIIKETKSSATFNLRTQALKEFLAEKYKNSYKKLFKILELFKSIKYAKLEKTILKDQYLTFEQIRAITEKMTTIVSLATQALFWSGCRIFELINIKLKDIKTTDCAIIKIRSGKGGKERTVYLPLKLYNEIRKSFKGKTYLFETKSGKSYHRNYFSKEIKRQAKDYNISAKTLRHSKAMYLKNERKLSADQVAKALGHADVATTLKYYFHEIPGAKDQGIIEAQIF